MNDSKRCPRCVTLKPRSDFHRATLRADGLQPYCRACRAEIDHDEYERSVGRTVPRTSRPSYAVARGAWLRRLKAGRPCTDCGRVFAPQVMQWDHLPQFEKVRDISEFSKCTQEEILDELKKCELVCTNCHTIRTFRRKAWGPWSVHEAEARYGETWTLNAV